MRDGGGRDHDESERMLDGVVALEKVEMCEGWRTSAVEIVVYEWMRGGGGEAGGGGGTCCFRNHQDVLLLINVFLNFFNLFVICVERFSSGF